MEDKGIDHKKIINLIVSGDTEKAIEELSNYYGVKKPNLKVGIPKGKYKALAMYDPIKNTIYFRKGEYMYNAFIVLHEFYHVIRIFCNRHRGNEKKADEFALEFLQKLYKIK
jgi:hypothetical protein